MRINSKAGKLSEHFWSNIHDKNVSQQNYYEQRFGFRSSSYFLISTRGGCKNVAQHLNSKEQEHWTISRGLVGLENSICTENSKQSLIAEMWVERQISNIWYASCILIYSLLAKQLAQHCGKNWLFVFFCIHGGSM